MRIFLRPTSSRPRKATGETNMKRILHGAVGITFVLIGMLASAQARSAQASTSALGPKQQQATSPTKAPAAQPAALRDMRYYVIVNGDTLSGSWDSTDSPNAQELRARYGEHFAWFREG